MKILVVHHARSLTDQECYIKDDFSTANGILQGAQALDTWAGIRLLSQSHEVWRLEISLNRDAARLVNSLGEVEFEEKIGFTQGIQRFNDHHYLKSLIFYMDPSIAFFSNSRLKQITKMVLLEFDWDVTWWETQFYDSLILDSVHSVVRSVNYEPAHVLAEDSSRLRRLRVIGKYRSEFLISQRRNLVAISPNDYYSYQKMGAKNLSLLPLRQLPFLFENEFITESQNQSLAFCGSTFSVLHNARNLDFIINSLSPALLVKRKSAKIQVFGSRLPKDITFPVNVEYRGFVPNLQGIQRGSSGVIVPYNGGAGMQSKIFEPLCLGVPIIANPKNFGGYDFRPGVHYFPATNLKEYISGVDFLLDNPSRAKEMASLAQTKALHLFCRQQLMNQIDSLLLGLMS